MPDVQTFPRRILWVDAEEPVVALPLLRARHLAVRWAPRFEAALPQLRAWTPHLLVLDYGAAPGAMRYETFVHAALPLADPYRPDGPLAANPWRYRAIPILLVAGGLPATVPGYVVPHLARAVQFLRKPCAPARLAQVALQALPCPVRGLIIDPARGQVDAQGRRIGVSPRELALLVVLAQLHPQPCTAAALAQRLATTPGWTVGEAAVRMAVLTLRRKLEADPAQPRHLRNEGQGYFLVRHPTLLPSG